MFKGLDMFNDEPFFLTIADCLSEATGNIVGIAMVYMPMDELRAIVLIIILFASRYALLKHLTYVIFSKVSPQKLKISTGF